MISLIVRVALPEDWNGISEVSRLSGYEDYINRIGPEYLKDGEVIVALHDKAIVGFMKMQDVCDGSSWFSGIRVHPNFRRLSVATSLTDKAIELARTRGIGQVRLLIQDSNSPSIALARKFGFRPVDRFAFFNGHPKIKEQESHGPSELGNPEFLNMGWIFVPYSKVNPAELERISFEKNGTGYKSGKNMIQIVSCDDGTSLEGDAYCCMEVKNGIPSSLMRYLDTEFDYASVFQSEI